MSSLTSRVALVTGASKGIGAGIARALASRGARVVVNYATSRDGADTVVSDIVAKRGEAIAVQANVARRDDVDRLFRQAQDAFGPVTIVVNNAATLAVGALEGITERHFEDVFAVNVWGPLLVTQTAAKQMGPDGGSIINIGSTSSNVTLGPNKALYAGSKGALDVMTRVMACELGPRNIRVNAVRSGLTDTEGARAMGSMSETFTDAITARTALGRIGVPEDIALAVAFLASDDARWITGELINVSGGLY